MLDTPWKSKKKERNIAATAQQIERDGTGVLWSGVRDTKKRAHENPFRFSAKIQILWEITSSQYSELCHCIHYRLVLFGLLVPFASFRNHFYSREMVSVFWIQRERNALNGVLNHTVSRTHSLTHSHVQFLTNLISLCALWRNQFECVHDFMQTADEFECVIKTEQIS